MSEPLVENCWCCLGKVMKPCANWRSETTGTNLRLYGSVLLPVHSLLPDWGCHQYSSQPLAPVTMLSLPASTPSHQDWLYPSVSPRLLLSGPLPQWWESNEDITHIPPGLSSFLHCRWVKWISDRQYLNKPFCFHFAGTPMYLLLLQFFYTLQLIRGWFHIKI